MQYTELAGVLEELARQGLSAQPDALVDLAVPVVHEHLTDPGALPPLALGDVVGDDGDDGAPGLRCVRVGVWS